uniref:Uncharacterized protein n=1 Tax=Ditylenchus dipsaci TaxID=166011 RepID=A0A915EID9_9BILA
MFQSETMLFNLDNNKTVDRKHIRGNREEEETCNCSKRLSTCSIHSFISASDPENVIAANQHFSRAPVLVPSMYSSVFAKCTSEKQPFNRINN